METSRRSFLITTSRLMIMLPAAAVGLCGGCDESVPATSQPDPQKSKEVEDKTRDFMREKKSSKKK